MSDQEDFFFDEEEKPAEPKKAPAPRSKAAAGVAAPSAASSFGGQSVTMAVAGLIAVCALLVGVIIGILVGGTDNVPAPSATTGTGVQQPAPQLTDEQLKGGQLPEGHPTIPSAEPTATGEAGN